jgi:hypothetical protein
MVFSNALESGVGAPGTLVRGLCFFYKF